MKIRTLKLSELSSYISQSINQDQILQNVHVEGELSNFKVHSTGTLYFSLKEDDHKIKGIIFSHARSEALGMEELSDGDLVICKGNIKYYQKEGYISMIVAKVEKKGSGESYLEYLRIKTELEAKGYFDIYHKKEIPIFPKKIGIITSITGAVIKDIYHVIERRYPKVELIVYPTLVQGSEAAPRIAEGIEFFNTSSVDTIILARGGGSYEELNVFNDPIIAEAIFNSTKPIISAVGHETDFTIADFVADVRASTPSVAAELAVPLFSEVKASLDKYKVELSAAISQRIEMYSQRVLVYKNNLETRSPKQVVKNYQIKVGNNIQEINDKLKLVLANKKRQLDERSNHIFSKNPDSIFDYGAALVYNEIGEQISTVSMVEKNMQLMIVFKDGKIKVKVIEDEI